LSPPTRPRIIIRSGSNDIKGTAGGGGGGRGKGEGSERREALSQDTADGTRSRKREREGGREREREGELPPSPSEIRVPRGRISASVRDNRALLYRENHAIGFSRRFSIPPPPPPTESGITHGGDDLPSFLFSRPFPVPRRPDGGPEWRTRATASLVCYLRRSKRGAGRRRVGGYARPITRMIILVGI